MTSSPCKCATDLSLHIINHSKTLIHHISVNDSKRSYISGVAFSELRDHFEATQPDKTKRYHILDITKFDHGNLAND